MPGNEGRIRQELSIRFLLSIILLLWCSSRIPSGWGTEVEEDVQKMREKGIIRPLFSSYAAPVCPVRKRDGTLRLCIDYRALNAKTINDDKKTINDDKQCGRGIR